jgi:protein-S-isoprenylcysteine O-methyltransferase Ste14
MGYIYTIFQFVGLGLIFSTPPFIPQSIIGKISLLLSFVIAVWAVLVFRRTKINVFPYLRPGSRLVRTGPYRYVRHPMYTSVLLFGLSYFIDSPNLLYFSYFTGLLVVVLLKIKFEEKQLANHFDNYNAEFFKTYRIIPCIY